MKARGAALALAGTLTAACSADGEIRPPRPDVVLVVIDTLRADHLPIYGGTRAETPFLDALAEESLVFDGAWSTSSWTAPAAASLFTSLYPSQHGVLTGLRVARHRSDDGELLRLNRIPHEVETLPETMRRLGYRTFGAVDNPTVCEEMGFARGFDRFVALDYEGAGALVDAAARWCAELERSRPYFLYLHFMDPHGPYHAREPWFDPSRVEGDLWERIVHALGHPPEALLDEETEEIVAALGLESEGSALEEAHALVREAYDSEISWLDRRLAEAFGRLGIGGDALVIFTADHGEELGDRGRVGHGFQLHEELVRLPLLVRLPEGDRRTGRVRGAFSLVDVLPTLRAYLGDAPADADTGRDLLAGAGGGDRVLFAERHREGEPDAARKLAVRHGSLKAIVELPDGGTRLYDLAADPGEEHDLAGERPEDARRLARAYEELVPGLSAYRRSFTEVRVDEEERRVLERLGYVEEEGGAADGDGGR